jgi:hypothetical protein
MAKVTIDKEALVKNRFWIMLGVIVPLVLAALLWLWTAVSSDMAKNQKAIQKDKSDWNALLKYNTTIKEYEALETKAQELTKQQAKVWQAAWDEQQDLLKWPPLLLTDDIKRKQDITSLYFGEHIDDDLRDRFIDTKAYRAQVQDLAKMVAPTVFKKTAPDPKVEGWEMVLKPVNWNVTAFGRPTVEEIWLAAEDLMIQRELLLAVQQTNNSVARFVREEDMAKKPKVDPIKGEQFREIFRNPYWELDLTLSKKGGKWYLSGKIKNIGNRRQMLARVSFTVWGAKDLSEKVTVEGESLAPEEMATLQFKEDDQLKTEKLLSWIVDPTEGLLKVEQELDLNTVPVKRIDLIAIGQHGHRTHSPKLLQPGEKRTGASPETAAAATAETPPVIGAPAGPQTSKTRNGLERKRYMDATDQVRRLPVAFVVVVDQGYGEELMTAISNLKLRLQTTQADWHRFRGDLLPPDRTQPMPMVVGNETGAAARAAAQDKLPMSLVELAYYGVASLYERYPPRNAAPPPDAVASVP